MILLTFILCYFTNMHECTHTSEKHIAQSNLDAVIWMMTSRYVVNAHGYIARNLGGGEERAQSIGSKLYMRQFRNSF